MVGGRLGESIGMREELIKKACSLSLKAHKASGKPYLYEKSRGSSEAVFSFPGSWSLENWFNSRPFGDTKALFPSLRCIGSAEVATVNEAFFRRFEVILKTTSFEIEVLYIYSLYFLLTHSSNQIQMKHDMKCCISK